MADPGIGALPEVSLGWTRGSVPLHTHACFYYSDEATLRATLAFLREGLDASDEFNIIFADASRHAGLLAWLQEGYHGDVEQALASGRLALVPGAPTKGALLGNIATTIEAGLASGHRIVRLLGFIAWGAPGWPDEDELLEFEAEINAAVRSYPAVVICTYGVPTLSGRQLIHGGLTTHAVVVLDEHALADSPFFVDAGSGVEPGK